MGRYMKLVLAAVILLWSCNDDQQAKEAITAQPPKDNYLILLDMSDRIVLNNQQQVPKDIELIKSIYTIFKTGLNNKDSSRQYYNIADKLKLQGAPHWFYAGFDLAAEQPEKRASMPDKIEKTFTTLLPEIYRGSIAANKTADYAGADIVTYFNDYLAEDLDKDCQNTLFLITDGYMNVKKGEEKPPQHNRYASCTQVIDALKNSADWEKKFTEGDYGLLRVPKKFTNLRVIVLQLTPREGWSGEYALLSKIWAKWFAEMGITQYSLVKNDSIISVKETLAKLMHVKISDTALAEKWAPVTNSDSAANARLATEKKTFDTLQKKNVTSPVKITEPEKVPVTAKNTPPQPETAAPAAVTSAAKRNSSVSKIKKPASTPAVVPPDESDTRLLTTQKPGKPPAAGKTNVKNNDDILQDAGAANGFNTGIKKDSKKKNH